MRDPRSDPQPGDVLRDRLGLLRVMERTPRGGVVWHRQPVGLLSGDVYKIHVSLEKWTARASGAEIVSQAKGT